MEEEKDEEMRDEVLELLELTRENNRFLRRMARYSRYRQVFSFLYFALTIGVMLYLYYYLQPYIENLVGLYETLSQYEGSGEILFPEFLKYPEEIK